MMWASFAEGVFVGAGIMAISSPICKRLPRRTHYAPMPEPEIEEPHIHNAAVEATAEAVKEFAVAGKSTRLPFRVRKQQLREAERSKRRKMEEWRD